jgi:soluble cytochrome b562
VDNNKFQDIRSQAVEVWKQLQLGQMPTLMPLDRHSKEDRAVVEARVAEPGELEVADDPDRFCETTAPISKLNIPKVNVDPWSAFWVILAAITGGTGITSYMLLTSVPPLPNCQSINPILSTDSERLYCAQIGADTRELPKLVAAVNVVKSWSENHPLYNEAQRLLAIWSKNLTRIAREQINQGDMTKALNTLKAIPPNSPTYDQTQELIAKWSDQLDLGAEVEKKFDLSLREGDWDKSFAQLKTLQQMRSTYWNNYKHEQLSLKLSRERDGWDKLQEALDALEGKKPNGYLVGAKRSALHFADKNGKREQDKPLPTKPEPIIEAMEIANQIDPSTYVYQRGQELRTTWSKHLVALTVGKFKDNSFNEAIEIAKTVPSDVAVYRDAQDWVKINQANVAASKRHILALMDALNQVKQIDKSSPVYQAAQLKKTQWQGLLKQQTQLQWARAIGSFQHPSTLAMAIATAKEIPANSSEATAAQSEIANWSRQIQTVDNRLILAKAQQLVSKGETLANLKAAAKMAGKITKDQPMGAEATQEVANWTNKIQTIEDQPVLDRAQALANNGRLSEAIHVAQKIGEGRSLYRTAQGNIRYWSLELQEIADRRTLNHAIAIYRQGQISNAIDLASTISRRSPVYGEARSYISDWRALIAPKSVYSFNGSR